MAPDTETLILHEIRLLRQEVQELRGPVAGWLGITDLARLMNRKDRQHLRDQITSGKLPIKYRQVKHRYAFERKSVEKYLEDQTV